MDEQRHMGNHVVVEELVTLAHHDQTVIEQHAPMTARFHNVHPMIFTDAGK